MIEGESNGRPRFLSVSEVLTLHLTALTQYGGATGVRDMGLLESAVAQPAASFGNEFVHDFPFGMAAAYAFHIARNHPFVDGNKRAAFASAALFLWLNGWQLDADEDDASEQMLSLAAGELKRDEFAQWLHSHSVSR